MEDVVYDNTEEDEAFTNCLVKTVQNFYRLTGITLSLQFPNEGNEPVTLRVRYKNTDATLKF